MAIYENKITEIGLLKSIRKNLFNKEDEDGNIYYDVYSHELIDIVEETLCVESIRDTAELSIILKYNVYGCLGDDWEFTNEQFYKTVYEGMLSSR